MTGWLSTLSDDERKLARKAKQPGWTSPMLATLTREPFSDPDWLFERKLDGERALLFKEGDDVQLFTRDHKPINDTYSELMEGLERQRSPFAGEVKESGVTWVTPELVGAFGFTEWTTGGKLRHPRFLGLRRDKAAREVRRERPEADG